MAYTDFIAAIDLGTSHIVGVVGTKSGDGVLSIIAHEVESSDSCIRRGCVYNVEETANKIGRLIRKLNNKLPDAKIKKVYVGLGGHSLRTIEHIVPKSMGADGVVTEEIVDALYKECSEYHPDMLDVLEIVSPVYYLDGKRELNPVGIHCNRLDASYKLVVGRPSLRRNLIYSIAERAKMEIADIVVSPLALADTVLSDDEKDLGCALIGFGAGVTTLTVYKGGQLIGLSVIPFGSNLITKDITNLNLVESEAERVKKTYGSAVPDKDDDSTIQVSSVDGAGLREVKLQELNYVVEARIQEILENVYARLEETGKINELGAGIVISGGAAALKDLPEAIKNRFKMDVRYATIRKNIVIKGDAFVNDPENMVAISLLMYGNENCAEVIVKSIVEPSVTEEKPTVEPPKKKEEKKGPGFFKKIVKNIDIMSRDLFDEDGYNK